MIVVVDVRSDFRTSRKSRTMTEGDHQIGEGDCPPGSGNHDDAENLARPAHVAGEQADEIEKDERDDRERNGGEHGSTFGVSEAVLRRRRMLLPASPMKKAGVDAGLDFSSALGRDQASLFGSRTWRPRYMPDLRSI